MSVEAEVSPGSRGKRSIVRGMSASERKRQWVKRESATFHDSAEANQEQKEVALALVSQISSKQTSAGSVLVCVLLCHGSYMVR